MMLIQTDCASGKVRRSFMKTSQRGSRPKTLVPDPVLQYLTLVATNHMFVENTANCQSSS